MYKIDESIFNSNAEELLTRIECITAYMNHSNYTHEEIILAMLGIEEVSEEMSLLTDNTGGYAE